jgi:hypothetical protein
MSGIQPLPHHVHRDLVTIVNVGMGDHLGACGLGIGIGTLEAARPSCAPRSRHHSGRRHGGPWARAWGLGMHRWSDDSPAPVSRVVCSK